MLSAIVICHANIPASKIVRTLAALVPATVQGLVGDLVLCAPNEGLFRSIADDAGCTLSGSFQLGAARALARADWLLLILAGYAPLEGFIDEAGDFVSRGIARAGLLRAVPDSLFTRLLPGRAPLAGMLVPQALAATNSGRDFHDLERVMKPHITLNAQARLVI